MSGIKNALTRKIGPAPAWIWAAIVGVAIFLYRRNSAGAAVGGGGSQQAADTAYYGPYGQNPYDISGSAGFGGGGPTGGGLGDTPVDTLPIGSGSGPTAPPIINIAPPGSSATPPTTHAPAKPKPPKRTPKPKPKPGKGGTPNGGRTGGKKGRPRAGAGDHNNSRGKPTGGVGLTKKNTRPRPPAKKNPPKTRPKAGRH